MAVEQPVPRVRKLAGRAIARRRADVIAAHGLTCCICGRECDPAEPYDRGRNPRYPTVEHLLPQSAGGTHDLDNLRLAHKGCNSARGNRPPSTGATLVGPWTNPAG